jgi:hypothetical protein
VVNKRVDGQHFLVEGLNIADHDAAHRVIFFGKYLRMAHETGFARVVAAVLLATCEDSPTAEYPP